jgi:CO/xanthine dehydrogenase Mo-binding subunit
MATQTKPVSQYKVIGTRPIRPDGIEKVTGKAKFAADYQDSTLLHGKVLRSPHAHANIKSINIDKALKYPGVKAIITSKDFAEPPKGLTTIGEGGSANLQFISANVLAREKVLYKGHAIAAIAATSPHIAEEALDLIEVEYEVLKPVLTAQEAMKEDAPILHQTMTTTSGGQDTGTNSNIPTHTIYTIGDAEKGFEEADVIIEREFTTSTVHQGYIEPHASSAMWDAKGDITVWTSTQTTFGVRSTTAAVVGVPVSKVRVIPMEIGGGFGGKIPAYLDPVAAVLSKKSGKPVKVIMSRADVLEASGPGAGTYMKVKIGATKDGRMVAGRGLLAFEAGAFPGSPVTAGAMCMFSCYNLENAMIDAYDVVVNKPKTTAYRAPGAPQAAFAVETIVDEICEKLELDPLEFRLKNASKEGDRRVDGVVFNKVGNVEVLKAAKASPHYKSKVKGKNRGRGVASGFWFNAGLQSSVNISVNPDGTVSLVEGSVDIGGTRASISMQAAEVLGLKVEDVHTTVVDTDSIGFTGVTGGSRTAFATGYAAYEAANDVVEQMKSRAAMIWETSNEDVAYETDIFTRKSNSDQNITFKELSGKLHETGGPIVGKGIVTPRGVGPAFAHHIVDVEVDTDTGKVDVIRYTALQDPGTAIHPSYVEGQIQGAVAQGIGWAINEEYYYNAEGGLVNASLLDYRMPTALDLPMLETILVEVPNPGHPFGVRGVGEVPIVPPLAAIANAVYDAIGVRFYNLPMNPGRVLEAIWEQKL